MENPQKTRFEARVLLDQYYSVEFLLRATGDVYQFKLRDMSQRGLGVLVREDSAVLRHLNTGDTLEMKYYPPEDSGYPAKLTTRICHITKTGADGFAGHMVVGLEITASHAFEAP